MSEFSDWYFGVPEITRYWFTGSVVLPLLGRFGVFSPYLMLLEWNLFFHKFQVCILLDSWSLYLIKFLEKLKPKIRNVVNQAFEQAVLPLHCFGHSESQYYKMKEKVVSYIIDFTQNFWETP